MYGLVNKAVADLVCSRYGEATWERIKRDAGVDVEVFVGMEDYPDDVTYRLVASASKVLSIPADTLLEAFGEYWTLYTAQEGYGELLRMGGTALKDFLLNLHNLHTHVALSFPKLKPPSFWCTEVNDGSLRLHYQSTRPGLTPMVVGLIKGLGKMFDTEVTVTQTQSRATGADHDEFLLRFGTPA